MQYVQHDSPNERYLIGVRRVPMFFEDALRRAYLRKAQQECVLPAPACLQGSGAHVKARSRLERRQVKEVARNDCVQTSMGNRRIRDEGQNCPRGGMREAYLYGSQISQRLSEAILHPGISHEVPRWDLRLTVSTRI